MFQQMLFICAAITLEQPFVLQSNFRDLRFFVAKKNKANQKTLSASSKETNWNHTNNNIVLNEPNANAEVC